MASAVKRPELDNDRMPYVLLVWHCSECTCNKWG